MSLDWDSLTEEGFYHARALRAAGWSDEGIVIQLRHYRKPAEEVKVMRLKDWEEKHKQEGIKLNGGGVAVMVGEDRSDVRRLDAMNLTDYFVKFFRGKWASLQSVYKTTYYDNKEWYG